MAVGGSAFEGRSPLPEVETGEVETELRPRSTYRGPPERAEKLISKGWFSNGENHPFAFSWPDYFHLRSGPEI